MKSLSGEALGGVLESLVEMGRQVLDIENGGAGLQRRRDATLEIHCVVVGFCYEFSSVVDRNKVVVESRNR